MARVAEHFHQHVTLHEQVLDAQQLLLTASVVVAAVLLVRVLPQQHHPLELLGAAALQLQCQVGAPVRLRRGRHQLQLLQRVGVRAHEGQRRGQRVHATAQPPQPRGSRRECEQRQRGVQPAVQLQAAQRRHLAHHLQLLISHVVQAETAEVWHLLDNIQVLLLRIHHLQALQVGRHLLQHYLAPLRVGVAMQAEHGARLCRKVEPVSCALHS